MRIAQGYISKSIAGFPMHKIFDLHDYRDYKAPCVFFGMYRYEDLRLLTTHQGERTIFWTGQDALKFNWSKNKHINARHVTAHPKVYDLIRQHAKCTIVKPTGVINTLRPQQLGPRIYAYCPASAPDYHGVKIIEELRRGGHEIIIGDGSIPQYLWAQTQDGFYADIFIGLCLSEFAGGGGSIIEMGLRGIKVVTNVFKLPNCLPFGNVLDVVNLIEQEKKNIGIVNTKLAQDVWDNLDHTHEWLGK